MEDQKASREPTEKYLEKMSMRKLNNRQSNYVYQTSRFYSIGNKISGCHKLDILEKSQVVRNKWVQDIC